MMAYPTMEQVEQASQIQLARWYRFLESPGTEAIDKSNFDEVLREQVKIQARLLERFESFGGWNPTLSKQVGW